MFSQASLLRYSGKIMSNYIKSYRLLNFQSWGENSPDINLETDMVNIIEGANETGKSVLYKVLYNFCFPNYWTPIELIRRGCEAGVMLLELQDGATIIYVLKPREYSYILVEPDDTKKVWTNQGCPDEIIQRLGLILDKDTQVILNVIDSDIALPFIKTTPKFNASLIRAIVEPEGMTRFFENLQNTSQRVENAKFYFSEKSKALDVEIKRIEYINVDEISDKKSVVDHLLRLAESVNKFETAMTALRLIKGSYPVEVQDPSIYKSLIDSITAIDKLNKNIRHLQEVNQIRIPEVSSVEAIEQNILQLEHLNSFIPDISKLYHLVDTTPREVILPDIGDNIDAHDILSKTIHSLKCIFDLKVDLEACQECPNLDADIQILDSLFRCKTSIQNYISCLSALRKQEDKMNSLAEEINTIVNRAGICPTCGQLLRGI